MTKTVVRMLSNEGNENKSVFHCDDQCMACARRLVRVQQIRSQLPIGCSSNCSSNQRNLSLFTVGACNLKALGVNVFNNFLLSVYFQSHKSQIAL